jgi:hypothetical protein
MQRNYLKEMIANRLGLVPRVEVEMLVQTAVKAAILKDMPRWLAQEADAEKFNLPDPSVYGNQADLFRKLSWVLQAVDITAQSVAVSKFSVARE